MERIDRNRFSASVTTALCLRVLLYSMLVGTAAYARTGGAAPADKSFLFDKARYFGQCEIFLLKGQPGKYEALVYNTTPLNDCPPAKFDPIDPKLLAQKTGSDLAWKNPRRFWTMDRLTVALVGEPVSLTGSPSAS